MTLVKLAARMVSDGVEGADAILIAALRTSGGQKACPTMAKEIETGSKHGIIVQALASTLSSLSAPSTLLAPTPDPQAPLPTRRNNAAKMPLVSMIVSQTQKQLSSSEVAACLHLHPTYVRKAVSETKRKGKDSSRNLLEIKQLNDRQGKLATHTVVQEIIEEFFESETSVFSGATRTRKLLIPKTTLLQRFSAKYPELLRGKATQSPELLKPGRHSKHYTLFQAGCRAATWAAHQAGFDEKKEFDTRLDAAVQRDLDLLVNKRLRNLGIRTSPVERRASTKVDLSVEGFDPANYDIKAPADQTFWKVLEARGIRYTQVHNPCQCPIHDNGPAHEAALAKVDQEIQANVRLEQDQTVRNKRRDLLSERRALQKDVDLYRQHLRQFEKQRKYVQNLEARLEPGEGVLYRDYVNDHDETGAKICNLQFVLVERKVKDGPLVLTNISNLAEKEACDAYFTADVFDFHLSKGDEHHPGLFDHIHTLYIVGDHGPHFSSNNTILNETNFFSKYGKKVYAIFLCSYHAFNRCDGAGVVSKRLAKQEQKQGKGPVGAPARSDLINSSSYHNHISFPFAAINRSANVFPEEVEMLPHARQCCDMKYHHTANGVDTREEGVVWFKMVSDVELPYQLHDLLKGQRDGRYMCTQCSNTTQAPVFHAKVTDCLRTTIPVNMEGARAAQCIPDPTRISGPQVLTQRQEKNQARKKRSRAEPKPVGPFPCKDNMCEKMYYLTPGGANRHMDQNHPGLFEHYPVPKKARHGHFRTSPLCCSVCHFISVEASSLCVYA